jgi:hypothetical protein
MSHMPPGEANNLSVHVDILAAVLASHTIIPSVGTRIHAAVHTLDQG